jgi:hypothetical protein
VAAHLRVARIAGVAAMAFGAFAAAAYFRAGLTLSHYDAKAHLVVARRIIDSLTPGWTQIGAVWLPLPHLLNALPVQSDLLYRTGASGVAISVVAFGVAAYALARLVLRATGSPAAAAAGVIVLAFDPNFVYLQATPMTEPLLVAFTMLMVALLYEWAEQDGRTSASAAGWTIVAACLTRYEAWPVTAAAMAAAWFAVWRRGNGAGAATRRVAWLAVYPAAAVLGFLVLSKLTIGEWFVTGGFFVPDPDTLGRPVRAAVLVLAGAQRLASLPLLVLGLGAAAVLLTLAVATRTRPALAVPLALGAAALLPWYAFVEGHPFRIRYMVPLIPAIALWMGVAAGLAKGRWRTATVLLVAGAAVLTTRPFDPNAPMVLEAQWDARNSAGRRLVTAYLTREHDGTPILASMGSLAHYMQELSHAGLGIRDFVHEGNGNLWQASLSWPRSHVRWILIEERAEGGDMLAGIARDDPGFLDGFDRVSEGGGVALFRRIDPATLARPDSER